MLKVRESVLIVKTVIDLAHNLSLTATAEGVEDDATLQQLSLLGCDFAQGFGLCRLQPLEQMIASVTA
jgi:EAL domain-containing protein (putative c-di-GMP-specific phosphodiesterase class I)